MVVVKSGGKTYANLLRQVKQSAEEEVEVKQVRKSRSGDLVLVMNAGNSEDPDRLKKTIATKTGITDVYTRRSGSRKVNIKNILESTNIKRAKQVL